MIKHCDVTWSHPGILHHPATCDLTKSCSAKKTFYQDLVRAKLVFQSSMIPHYKVHPQRRFVSTKLFPTCQVRVVRFYVRCAAPPSFFLLLPPSSFFLLLFAGPHLEALAVSLAGSHLPALDSNGPRRTSTGESLSAVGLAGPQPARVGALWASPDFNRRGYERCGPRRPSRV